MSDTQTSVPIPITTRGIGILSQQFYNYSKDIFGNELPCSVHQIYRVSLIQLDVRIQCCQQETVFPSDPAVDIYYPLTYFREFNDYTMMPKNFTIIARAINSVGNFLLNDIAYQPYIPSILDIDKHGIENGDTIEKNNYSLNPYLITIQNLRQILLSLADKNTPMNHRKLFIARNSMPGAIFLDDVLTNPNQILPNNYDFRMATEDILAFVNLLKMYEAREEYSHLIEPIYFKTVGHISILTTIHHPKVAKFSLFGDKLDYAGESTVRSFVRTNEQDQFDGCVNLMNEYPNFIGPKDKKRWSLRSKYLSCATYVTSWTSAIDCIFHNK